MQLPLLLLILLSTTQAANILRYRCFTDWMRKAGIPVRHVGIEVQTANGYSFIENLGSGTEINRPRDVDCVGNCFGQWWKPSRYTTTDNLVDAGGQEYNLVTNNCYDARDRMLSRIGDGEC